MTDLLTIMIGAIIALAIAFYATWLLFNRIKAGESKSKTFRQWLKHIFEAIFGL